MDLRSKDTSEKNKLIAEFMEFPTQTDVVDDRTLAYYVAESVMNTDKFENENDSGVFHTDDMQFHTSWDWLVPVLKKANEIISDNQKGLWRMLTHPFEYEIKDVHEQVVDFINYYNYENK